MMKLPLRYLFLLLWPAASHITAAAATETRTAEPLDNLIAVLSDELKHSMENLVAPDGTRLYYLAYTVYDEETAIVAATLGAISHNDRTRERNLNIDLRVGDYDLDNTRRLRGSGPTRPYGSGNITLPLDDNAAATRHALWLHTDRSFKDAVRRLSQIRTNLKVKVEEMDPSADFSREEPQVRHEPPAELRFDGAEWAGRLRSISARARDFPQIYQSSITIGAYAATRYLVSSEGTTLRTAHTRSRITLTAATKADDGMELSQSFDFNASTPAGLPDDETMKAAFVQLMERVLALRQAPLAEPYIGPAILRNRAAAVFFHEILGHRLEGHRQKDVTEGQTFTRKINEPILPPFVNVFDDPTMRRFAHTELRGYYLFDDEGTRAKRATLVENGVLKGFLMSRDPVEGFPRSTGHGRKQSGQAVVARQANLIVESTKQVPFERLRQMLIDECRRQNREYGLLFEDISGGFTMTGRRGPQSFKVMPIVVYRVYVDGRPDELIRGADIVGTPLTSLENILSTGDDPAVFNGTCGAESGWVPVSAVSPSILVSTIEIERRTHEQSRPPILDPPLIANPQQQEPQTR